MTACAIYRGVLHDVIHITHQQCLATKAKRLLWAHAHELHHTKDGKGTVTKAAGLDKGYELAQPVQKGRPYITGQFTVSYIFVFSKHFCNHTI